MATDFACVFAALKPALAGQAARLAVKTDSPKEYTLVTKSASPFPQHKGQPMWFGAISYHLMPLYMNEPLTKTISPQLRKHMQGKSCFNFKVPPDADVIEELRRLTTAADHWAGQQQL